MMPQSIWDTTQEGMTTDMFGKVAQAPPDNMLIGTVSVSAVNDNQPLSVFTNIATRGRCMQVGGRTRGCSYRTPAKKGL